MTQEGEQEKYIELFCSMLKSDGLKCTGLRQDILRLFFLNEHVSVSDILKILDKKFDTKTSKQSVYNTLNLLLSYGIISRFMPEKTPYYELTRHQDHFHLVCTKCQITVEFDDGFLKTQLDSSLKKEKFKLQKMYITLYGLCEDCNIDNQ